MFLRIEGHLLDVLGEKARGNIKEEFGIVVTPTYQFLDREVPVTLAQVIDPVKAEKLLSDRRVTQLDTAEQFNAEIDALYIEKYTLKDTTALLLDLQMSDKTAADISGYNTGLPMNSQSNLKALYNAGMTSGIKKTEKPPLFD